MELGSEFYIDLTDLSLKENTIYTLLQQHYTFYTDYGRTAISLLYTYLKETVTKVLLPSYICDSVIHAFPQEQVVFYELQDDFVVDEQALVALIQTNDYDGSIFYINHYFGKIQPIDMLERIQELCKKHRMIIIEDTTQSIFSKIQTIGDYCICSLRKWMPIPDGAVIYSQKKLPVEWGNIEHAKASAKIEAMILKKFFLAQNTFYKSLKNEEKINEIYRQIFVTEENRIDEKDRVYAISDISAFLLRCMDISLIGKRRKENYIFLQEQLKNNGLSLYGQGNFRNEYVPYVALMQMRKDNRDDFRKYLMEHRIYCAVHWPVTNKEQKQCFHVNEWTENLISLPIDQRYDAKEMQYLSEMIVAYFRK